MQCKKRRRRRERKVNKNKGRKKKHYQDKEGQTIKGDELA